MAEDKKIDYVVAENSEFNTDLATTFVDCYKSIFDIEIKIDDLEKTVTEIIPDDFVLCDCPLYLNKFTTLAQEIATLPNNLVSALNKAISGINDDTPANSYPDSSTNSLKLPLSLTKYPATTIILKRFQIIKYKCEILEKSIMVLMARLRKKVLLELLSGKDDAGSPTTTPIKMFLMGVAVTANVIATIIGIVLNIINAVVILNVDASGCAFGPTPKSLMMTSKMTVANAKGSTTCPTPEPIDKLITEAENAQKKTNGELKKAHILAMSAESASNIANGGQFSVGNFPSLPKIDGTAIRQSIRLLLATLIDAEALPRYEKLTPTNIRFLTFLITGFEPSAKKTFGLPGFP